jgi:hypothetical protein
LGDAEASIPTDSKKSRHLTKSGVRVYHRGMMLDTAPEFRGTAFSVGAFFHAI